jgi:hypothetical protein
MNPTTHPRVKPAQRSLLRRCAAVLALAACWSAAPVAGAVDKGIDRQLQECSDAIMKDLRTHGYKNVGVLKFQVQKGETAPSLRVGRLNTVMATRLENALILANDDDTAPIGITRGASTVAATEDAKATYLTPEGRKLLFERSYPMAWGKEKVKVDAFLTGLVKVNPTTKKATVVIEVFDKENLTPRKVADITAPTDRRLLADMGQPFTLTKRELNVDEAQLNEAATEAAFRNEGKPPDATAEDLSKLLTFTVYYDDRPIKPDAQGMVATPRPKQKVYFTAKSTERLGLVLRVNGINTLGYEKDPRELWDYSVWVLEPGKEYRIEGFYPAKEKMKRFEVVAPDAVDFAELGDENKLGQIDIDVFREQPDGRAPPEEKKIRPATLREVPEPAANLPTLRGNIRSPASRKLAIRHKGIMVGGDVRIGPNVEEVPFVGRWCAHRTITYYRTEGAKDYTP